MADEISNLILEQLRLLRAEIASIKQDIGAVRERMNAMEAQLTGLTYLVTTGLGSVLHDIAI